MVDSALLARVDLLDAEGLDELIDYAQAKRTGDAGLSAEQRDLLQSRRDDAAPANWLTDDQFDARLDQATA